MPKFLVTCHGGNPPTEPDGIAKHTKEWEAWIMGLGAAFTFGAPVGNPTVVTDKGLSDSGSPHPVMGVSILEGRDMDHALEMVKDCPALSVGGTVEVSEAMDVPS